MGWVEGSTGWAGRKAGQVGLYCWQVGLVWSQCGVLDGVAGRKAQWWVGWLVVSGQWIFKVKNFLDSGASIVILEGLHKMFDVTNCILTQDMPVNQYLHRISHR